MGHLISARRSGLVIDNKQRRTCQIVNFSEPADCRVKLTEGKLKERLVPRPCRRTEKNYGT